MPEPKKIFALKPDWKYNLFPYIISVLLLPVFGIGILVFIYFYRRISSLNYAISDDDIAITDGKETHTLLLKDIRSVSISKTWAEQQTGLGTLHLQSGESEFQLIGVNQPEDIKDAIELALASIREHLKATQKADEGLYPEINPGGLEHMNTLVGLWQQGLISNDDYEAEKKKFVKNPDSKL